MANRRTDTMDKRKKRPTAIYKKLDRKSQIEQHEPH